MTSKYAVPEFPRVIVSPARHRKLAGEAKSRKISISKLVEEKLKVTA